MHDASKVLLGGTKSSFKKGSEVFDSSPATFPAGLAVRRANTGLLSVSSAAGRWAGISLGKDLSDASKTCVLSKGKDIPILLEAQPARGTIEITDFAALVSGTDDGVVIGATTFVAQEASVTPTQATFQAAVSDEATAASLAAQINAHVATAALVRATVVGAVVTITAKSNTAAGNDIVLEEDENDSNSGMTVSGEGFLEGGGAAADYVVPGQPVYISDTTGKADDPNSAASVSAAVYASGPMIGIAEDGSEVAIALIDAPGGL